MQDTTYQKAISYIKEKRLMLALYSIDTYIRRNPEDPLGWKTCGKMLMEYAEYDLAIDMFRIAIKKDLKSEDTQTLNFLINCLIIEDRLDEAFDIYEILLHKSPNRPRLHTNVGVLEIHRSNYSASEMYLLKALELDEKNPSILQMLMLLYAKWNKPEKFEEIRQKGQKEFPNIEEFIFSFKYASDLDLEIQLMYANANNREDITW